MDGDDVTDTAQKTEVGDKDKSDALSRAVASVLGGVLEDFSTKAIAVAKSQDNLGFSLDRLTRGRIL